jgi:hypothetical protein
MFRKSLPFVGMAAVSAFTMAAVLPDNYATNAKNNRRRWLMENLYTIGEMEHVNRELEIIKEWRKQPWYIQMITIPEVSEEPFKD